MIRLFAAIAIPEEVGAALLPRQDRLPGARWRPLEDRVLLNGAKTVVFTD